MRGSQVTKNPQCPANVPMLRLEGTMKDCELKNTNWRRSWYLLVVRSLP